MFRRLDLRTSIAFLVVSAIPIEAARGGDIPEALRRFVEERRKAATGAVEWSETTAAGTRGLTEERVRFMFTQFGGDTVAVENRGDENGVVTPYLDGTVGPGSRRPHRGLFADGKNWSYEAGAQYARLYATEGPVPGEINARVSSPPDPRGLGISSSGRGTLLHDRTWSEFDDFEGLQVQEWNEDELRIVRATTAEGASTQWWIDPAKGWSIVRVARLDALGAIQHESRLTIESFDGVWLPAEVQTYSAQYEYGTIPVRSIQLLTAEINRPGQPARLGPADIGIEPGTHVVSMNDPNALRTQPPVWNGRRLVDFYAWQFDREAEVEPTTTDTEAAPTVQNDAPHPERNSASAEPTPPTDSLDPRAARHARESSWQQYTREFIARYQLNAQQSRRAWSICRACEADRDKYLAAHRDDFAELVKAVLIPDAIPAPAADKAEQLTERRQQLEAPINAIFEEQLKPRLEKLPTQAQRDRAELGTATQPEPEP